MTKNSYDIVGQPKAEEKCYLLFLNWVKIRYFFKFFSQKEKECYFCFKNAFVAKWLRKNFKIVNMLRIETFNFFKYLLRSENAYYPLNSSTVKSRLFAKVIFLMDFLWLAKRILEDKLK